MTEGGGGRGEENDDGRRGAQRPKVHEEDEEENGGRGGRLSLPTSSLSRRQRHLPPSPATTVCGVKRCDDARVLDDPSTAFGWFLDRYPGSGAVEENKALLRAKYAEAKGTGEDVKKCRDRINYHKTTIERLRRDAAMEGIVASSSSSDSAGEEDPGGGEEDRRCQHPEEAEHRDAIEGQKARYKGGFKRLRDLKVEIEHVQHLMERGRSWMQSDFDVWYGDMKASY